jgi:hypothetical protein
VGTNEGGRLHPIRDGYRPVCCVRGNRSAEEEIGFVEVRLDRPVAPGEDGEGVLEFHRNVAEFASSRLPLGSTCSLMEGRRKIGIAEVLRRLDNSNEVG